MVATEVTQWDEAGGWTWYRDKIISHPNRDLVFEVVSFAGRNILRIMH